MYDDSLHVKTLVEDYYKDSGNIFGNLALKSYVENSALPKSELQWYPKGSLHNKGGLVQKRSTKVFKLSSSIGKLYGVDRQFSFNGSILAKV